MIVSAIVAMDRNGLIGDGEKMPWHLPRDLKRFRAATLGKPVIMGRRTWESLPGPLPGRLNLVLTRDRSRHEQGFRVARSIDEALRIAEDYPQSPGGPQPQREREVMIIGGGVVYESTCPLWDRLLLTVVEGTFRGTTRFPVDPVDRLSWRLAGCESFEADAKNPHAHWFLTLERLRTEAGEDSRFALRSWLRGA